MTRNHQTNHPPSDKAAALSAVAQRYFATRFPNPQRHGCPAAGTLQAVVQAARLPEAELQTHLFRCSECFNEYRAAVLALAEQLLAEQESFADCALTGDFKRGVRAFVAKQPAAFRGD